MDIPGFIPLVPLNTHLPFTDSNSSSIPLDISDRDLQTLSTTTREAMEQRLKVLQAVQNQILQAMESLALVLSVLPTSTSPQQTEGSAQDANQNPIETTVAEQGQDEAEAMEDVQQTSTDLSERQKEKMPDYNATL
jgi:predicted RNA-binding protein with RPS1 domain